MPPETLQLHYSRIHRPNRRRQPVPGAVETFLRFLLIFLGLAVLIFILMRLGVIQERQDTIQLAYNPPATDYCNFQKV